MGTKTLLNGVNDLLKKAQIIAGDSGALASLTDSPRQNWIDTAVMVINETLDDLYFSAAVPRPNVLAENTITLATSDRDYALQSDLVQLIWPLIDETNGQYIQEYPGGYIGLVTDQPFPANETGLAYNAAIRPTDGQLYLDRIPTSGENGRVYKYRYYKDTELTAAADTFPVTDAAYRALLPAFHQVWERSQKRDFDAAIYSASLGRAARLMSQHPMKSSYMPYRIAVNTEDFLE